ncbi:MAG: type-F conjugative transfer system pilin assembly protein TrbC [Sulfuritalea sp.]|nr:type-F conjugative transfer system pilin assembly protein TrbC [Sulfuritalea sp.]
MTKRSEIISVTVGALLLMGGSCRAEDVITVDYEAVRRNNPIPSDARMDEALKSMKPEMDRALNAAPAKPMAMPEPAKPPALPETGTSGRLIRAPDTPMLPPHLLARPTKGNMLDPAALARAYETTARPAPSKTDTEFLMFVSFAIPPLELKKLIESAEEAKATVVFRGPIDKTDTSLRKFASKIQTLGLKRAGEIQINPPAFTKYRVAQVPAFVLAKVSESAAEQNGCAPAGSYASVDGLVAPEYALNIIKSRARPDIAASAERYLDALKAKRQ